MLGTVDFINTKVTYKKTLPNIPQDSMTRAIFINENNYYVG
jgi:hypothetical protein